MNVKQNISIALLSIRSQLLRTILTSLIIAIGIMALVGILTAIDAIKETLAGNFALLGANTFTIRNEGPNIRIGNEGKRPKRYENISYYEALRFKEKMEQQPAGVTSISYQTTGVGQAQYKNVTTNPNIQVMAVDENYQLTGGYELEKGRNFTRYEIDNAASVALVGQDIVERLFKNEEPLGKIIQVRSKRYRIVGVLASKGSSFGFGGDNVIWIPITNARQSFGAANRSFTISVMASSAQSLEANIFEATAMMRAVRKLKPQKEDNFNITKSDNLSQTLIENISKVTGAAVIIAAVTLLGAAIALMNIMLVSVTERTREIGIRKAIGAKSATIRNQFLTEAIVICLLGGAVGVILGIVIGNVTANLVGGSFIIPWLWMLVSALLCIVVGLISGFYPAYKASALDPIDSLRYE
jgi:putative ABC transport system permease protein